MSKVIAVLAMTLVCVSAANAQATVNYATRTATAASSATVPATAGQVTSASTTMQGALDTHTHTLTPSDLSNLVYRFQFSVRASATGVTDPTACCVLSSASIWLNGHVDDTQQWTSGFAGDFRVLENGYGDEFAGWQTAPGVYDLPFGFVGGSYNVYLDAITNLPGQGAGSAGSASATATLVGAFVLNSDGSIRNAATFDDRGNGSFAETTPEPSSLALLVPGLLGIAPFVRKRRAVSRT